MEPSSLSELRRGEHWEVTLGIIGHSTREEAAAEREESGGLLGILCKYSAE